jgi:hypothetical protein
MYPIDGGLFFLGDENLTSLTTVALLALGFSFVFVSQVAHEDVLELFGMLHDHLRQQLDTL